MAISAAGGVDGMALIDMAWRINPEIRVFTLDTGRLPPETYTLFEEIREHYGIAVEFEYPGPRRGDAAGLEPRGPEPDVPQRRPAARVLRRPQGRAAEAQARHARRVGRRPPPRAVEDRKNIAKVELDRDHGGIVKLNPLADWKLDEVWDYVRKHEVPYHELFDHGYTSIGCAPCTRPDRARRVRARRPLVVGGGHRQGMRHPLLRRTSLGTKSDRERAEEAASDDRRTATVTAMPFGYPVILELAGRRCVVIGALAVREGKVEGLLAAGADRRPSWSLRRPTARLSDLEALARASCVERRTWRADDLDGAFVCVASSRRRG